MDKEKEKLDREKQEKILENKKLSLRNEQPFEADDDGSNFPDHYDAYFDFLKMQENRSIQEIFFHDSGLQDVKITKR